ncbi:MAG: transposase [Desulfobulbaceae bacterium]|nr:transposase [Desulfobulbaceae bacterium]
MYHDQENEAGVFARRLYREIDSLWIFLAEAGVSPTNNHAERMIRFAVLWRKRSLGTYSDKGCRWAERILSLRQTCRLRGMTNLSSACESDRQLFQRRKAFSLLAGVSLIGPSCWTLCGSLPPSLLLLETTSAD